MVQSSLIVAPYAPYFAIVYLRPILILSLLRASVSPWSIPLVIPMKGRELINLGIPYGPAVGAAITACANALAEGATRAQVRDRVRAVATDPESHATDPHFAPVVDILLAEKRAQAAFTPRKPAPHHLWGAPGVDFDHQSVDQMRNACSLPVAVAGAMMPDAHVGYGLPIGGVLATRNAIIPYAVGVDIACRMKLTVLDMPAGTLDHGRDRLRDAILKRTLFGVGGGHRNPMQHDVMDQDWSVSPITKENKPKAWKQLGTSGSGNHFVEFGVLTIDADEPKHPDFALEPGQYLALMSHSGSRGTGAAVCNHYSRLAMHAHPELPKQLRYLAWLDLDSEPAQEYFAAMNLMGQYASANHAVIHREVLEHLGARPIAGVENHHNFAWKETHTIDGKAETLIVHRKGATPAGKNVLGVIPGSMASPAYVVAGLAKPESLLSAAHGAGRVMSRTQARQTFAWGNVNRELKEKGVELMSAGIDEVPGVYKDIHTVMQRQQDLVRPIARFDPKLVKMAPAGERPED